MGLPAFEKLRTMFRTMVQHMEVGPKINKEKWFSGWLKREWRRKVDWNAIWGGGVVIK